VRVVMHECPSDLAMLCSELKTTARPEGFSEVALRPHTVSGRRGRCTRQLTPHECTAYAAVMQAQLRFARVEDVHELALGMPHVKVEHGPSGNPVYQVGGKSIVFFRNPRPDAVDPETGERYTDVIVFWVASESDRHALVQDQTSPFFTTPHFDGHLSVLLRACRIGELSLQELTDVVQDAWLCRASPNRAATWLNMQHSDTSLSVTGAVGSPARHPRNRQNSPEVPRPGTGH
jgi:hypothetical protein